MRHHSGLFALLAVVAAAGPVLPAEPVGGQGVYHFAGSRSVARQLEVQPASDGLQLLWPELAAFHWDTALLGVRSLKAQAEPWVELAAGSASVRQYLDADATGIRWLNLSALHEQLQAGKSLQLHAHGLTLAAEPATLELFSNSADLHGTILVIAPHPDDAEIAAFGLYADRNTTIVTVTAGNAGDMNYRAQVSDPAAHFLLKGYLRAVDSVTVPWQGGVPPQHTYNLGYFDGRLDSMYQTPHQVLPEVYGPNTDIAVYRRVNLSTLLPNGSRQNSWDHLVEDLATILNKVHPAIIVTPDPRLDGHRDHPFATVAVAAALARLHGSATFFLYTNHADDNRYPYGPAGTVMSLPPIAAALTMQSVYSHPTDAALQTRKLFALESMHDLRLSPAEQQRCAPPDPELRPDYPRIEAVDYFRRAPRSNELFYVFDTAGLRALVRDFLALNPPQG